MDLALLVYGISLLKGFDLLMAFIVMISCIITIFTAIHTISTKFETHEYSWNLNKDGTLKTEVVESRKFSQKVCKWAFITFIVSSLISILIPNERTAYTMVGAYAAQKIAQNDKVQETGEKVLKLINQKLDKYIDEAVEVKK